MKAEIKMSSIPKPNLRNLLLKRLQLHIPISCAVAGTAGALYYQLVSKPRRKQYADYYSDYDADVSQEFMKHHLQAFGNYTYKKKDSGTSNEQQKSMQLSMSK